MADSEDPRDSDRELDQAPYPDSIQSKPPTFLQIALSVVAAAFGVQTQANQERDFANGKPIVFIIGGLVFTLLFVLSIIGVVNLVLA
ncbi:MAG: DUF2970 domain-containing protein [bacterium]|nr:DUF2970 domain-containing protein [Gammaproteobacteria bacterium]